MLSSLLVSYHIYFNFNLGIYCSDVFVYLLNGLYFTGENIRSTSSIYLSPVICYLTSILFRLGITDKLAIYIVTGIFAIIGNIGLYILLKQRFNELLSFLGVIIYSSFSLNLLWLANGSIDIPAVSVSIWIILFTIISVEKNSKYFLMLFPLFIIGFFTRYTVILLFPILILYYLFNKNFIKILLNKNKKEKLNRYFTSKEFKYIIIGIVIGVILAIAILIPINNMGSNLGFINQTSNAIYGAKGSANDNAYNTDLGFYINNLPNFLSSSKTIFIESIPTLENPTILSYLLIGIMAIGSVIWLYNTLKNKKSKSNKKIAGIIIILTIITIITFNQISSFFTIILTLSILLILNDFLKSYKIPYLNLTMLFMCLALIYLIFFTYINIKVDRYFIPILPAITYFIIASISLIQEKIKYKKVAETIIPIILIIIFIISSFGFTSTIEKTDRFIEPEEMSNYLIHYDPNYKNHSISSYNIRIYGWYLEKYTGAIPSSETELIDKSNMTYYISDIKIDNLSNYTEIKNIGNLYLYEKIRY